MTPLGGVVAGLLVVVLDLRINGFDLLLDPVGWVLMSLGVARLRVRHGAFLVAAFVGGVGALASLPAAVAPPTSPLQMVEVVVLTGFTMAVCTALADVLREPRSIEWARALRWMDPTCAVLIGALSLLARAVGVSGPVIVLLLVVGAFAVALLISFLMLLWRHRREVLPEGGAVAPV